MQFVIVCCRTAVKTAHRNQHTLSTGWSGDSSQTGRKINTLCQQLTIKTLQSLWTHIVNNLQWGLSSLCIYCQQFTEKTLPYEHILSTDYSEDSPAWAHIVNSFKRRLSSLNTSCQQITVRTIQSEHMLLTIYSEDSPVWAHFVNRLQWRLNILCQQISAKSLQSEHTLPTDFQEDWTHFVNRLYWRLQSVHTVNRLQWGVSSPNTCCQQISEKTEHTLSTDYSRDSSLSTLCQQITVETPVCTHFVNRLQWRVSNLNTLCEQTDWTHFVNRLQWRLDSPVWLVEKWTHFVNRLQWSPPTHHPFLYRLAAKCTLCVNRVHWRLSRKNTLFQWQVSDDSSLAGRWRLVVREKDTNVADQ